MKENRSLEILKHAILLEKRGKAFYETVAKKASDKPTKAFFQRMAEEETSHIRILSEQFKVYQDQGKFDNTCFAGKSMHQIASSVFTPALSRKIHAASFEAAAISAAMAMEEKAIRLYRERASKTRDKNEKALYRWLAEWETSHLEMLSDLEAELRERIWHDAAFWPF